MTMTRKPSYGGLVVAISSPSGGGKTTVIKELLKDKSLPFVYSISTTTRPKRSNEQEGRDYWFVNKDEFENLLKSDKMLEYEKVHDYFYGTPKDPILNWLENKKIVLLDIDVYGALSVRKEFKENSYLIFLQPPDFNTLKKRLYNRRTESKENIQKRLGRIEIEMSLASHFDVQIVNQDLLLTVKKIKALIQDQYLLINSGGNDK
jgi:guanylate kinase